MNDFYVGWSQETPTASVRAVRWFVGALVLAIMSSAVLVALVQPPFADSHFEFGTVRELRGTIRLQPAPFLTLEGSERQVLLVGPGKRGGSQAVHQIAQKTGQRITDKMVSVRGKLIFHDGKTAFELHEASPVAGMIPAASVAPVPVGEVTLRGEITDPKCLLGVMKPGEGITHRECAIRCIAGGITPVLRVMNAAGECAYYAICGPEGEPINDCLLPFVGIGVEIQGRVASHGDWLILYTDPANLRKVHKLALNAPMCR